MNYDEAKRLVYEQMARTVNANLLLRLRRPRRTTGARHGGGGGVSPALHSQTGRIDSGLESDLEEAPVANPGLDEARQVIAAVESLRDWANNPVNWPGLADYILWDSFWGKPADEQSNPDRIRVRVDMAPYMVGSELFYGEQFIGSLRTYEAKSGYTYVELDTRGSIQVPGGALEWHEFEWEEEE